MTQRDHFLVEHRFEDFDDFCQANRTRNLNVSHFAADYRRFFGEISSDTVGKKSSETELI